MMLTRTTLDRLTRGLRLLAAVALLLAGGVHAAALWLCQLNLELVLGAAVGCAYLFVALGLFGSSSFSLYLGALLPALHRYHGANHSPGEAPGLALAVLDWTVPALCLAVLALLVLKRLLGTGQSGVAPPPGSKV